MKTTILILALTLIGCTSPSPQVPDQPIIETSTTVDLAPYGAHVSLRIDSSMEKYAVQILDAAQTWEALGGYLILDEQSSRSITCGTSTDPMFAANGGIALAYEGAAGITMDCGFLDIVKDIEDEHEGEVGAAPAGTGATCILAHEMGHLYGLPHELTDPNGLMSPTSSCGAKAPFLTDADIKDWYTVHPLAGK